MLARSRLSGGLLLAAAFGVALFSTSTPALAQHGGHGSGHRPASQGSHGGVSISLGGGHGGVTVRLGDRHHGSHSSHYTPPPRHHHAPVHHRPRHGHH